MIKIFAMCITALSGVAFGLSLCKAEKERIEQLRCLLSLVSYISWSIENRAVPLPDVLREYKSETEKQGNANKTFLKRFNECRGGLGDKIGELALELCTENTARELSEFARTLGCTDLETQLARIRKAQSLLEAELSKSKEEYHSKSKLYKTLPVVCACVVALIMY